MLNVIEKYLQSDEPSRNFAEGVALLEATNPQNQTQLRAFKSYEKKTYINKQTRLALYIALRKYLETQKAQTPTTTTKHQAPSTKHQAPLSLYAIIESDPLSIRQLILDTGRMTDEAFAARNALFYLKSDKERLEYALKAVQLYRKAAENWQKIKTFRETGTLPPELMMTTTDIKKEVIDKIDRRKYLTERTYRLQSWLDGRTTAPPQYMEGKNIKPEWVTKWKAELDEKIQELELINNWLNND